MKQALSTETETVRRANDDTWRKKNQTKPQLSNNGDNRGKGKRSNSTRGGGDEATNKHCLKGGLTIKKTGVVIKNDKHGSGMAVAGE